MSVVQLDFYDREDINGAVTDSFTDEDPFFEAFEMRIGLRDAGRGQLTVSRQGAGQEFLHDIAHSEAFVRVLVPAISPNYIFGFFIDDRKHIALSADEDAGRDITLSGPGAIDYLSRAILWDEEFASTGAHVEPANGLWKFPEIWTPGKVFEMLVAEDAANTLATFLPDLTIDFNNNVDTDSNAWTDTFDGGLELAIGTDYLHALRIMQDAAVDLDARMHVGSPGSPVMELKMYNRYGRDLTGTSFGTGVVLWKGGIQSDPLSGNILTALEAGGSSTKKPSHVLVRGSDGVYKQVAAAGYSAGDFTKAVSADYDNTSGDDALFRFGRRIINDWELRADGLQLEIHPGWDESVGHYMPGPPGSDGHFWIGDDITLKTGGDIAHSVLDYHYSTERITGIRMVLDEASDDSTDETAALSWHIVPELNEVFGVGGHGSGICCGPRSPSAGTPGAPSCTRYYFSTDTTGVPTVTKDASWDFGNGQNGMSIEKGLLKGTKGPTATTSWGMGSHAVPINFHHGQFFLELPSAGTVSGSVKAIIPAKRRTGVGVTSSQRHQAQMVVRVVSADGSTVRGTALAAHEPGVLDSAFFQSTYQTLKFPASSQWGDEGAALTPVAHSAGDWLVVEIGSHTVIDGSGVGAAIDFEGTTSEADFPETEFLPVADGTAWIDICTAGTPAVAGDDPPTPIGEENGEVDPNVFAPNVHTHEHGDVEYDGSIDHDARSVEYDNDLSGLTGDNVQDALDELAVDGSGHLTARDGEQHIINTVVAPGSTLTLDLADGNVHEVTLDDDCAIDFTGFFGSLAQKWTVVGHWAGFTPTWTSAVIWPDDTEPTWSTDADAVDVVEFTTLDGGVTIYGDAGGSGTGGGGATDLDDLTDVTITAPAEDDDLRYNGSQWVNDSRKWEAVTGGEDIFVWDGDDLVYDWST